MRDGYLLSGRETEIEKARAVLRRPIESFDSKPLVQGNGGQGFGGGGTP